MTILEQRSYRLSGTNACQATSMRLEKPFWNALEQMADEAECTLSQLISYIDKGLRGEGNPGKDIPTLSSCLRVTCLRWLKMQARKSPRTNESKGQISRVLAREACFVPCTLNENHANDRAWQPETTNSNIFLREKRS